MPFVQSLIIRKPTDDLRSINPYNQTMWETAILISDGIFDAFNLKQIADRVGLYFRTGRAPEGWVCDSCANGVAFHLENEKGNFEADVSQIGYRKLEDAYEIPSIEPKRYFLFDRF